MFLSFSKMMSKAEVGPTVYFSTVNLNQSRSQNASVFLASSPPVCCPVFMLLLHSRLMGKHGQHFLRALLTWIHAYNCKCLFKSCYLKLNVIGQQWDI